MRRMIIGDFLGWVFSENFLQSCRVREIVVGETNKEEILEIQKWAKEQLGGDQVSLPCSAVSLDVEDHQTSLDVWKDSTPGEEATNIKYIRISSSTRTSKG